MFKSYKEPPKPSHDWTDTLIEKGIPLAGAALGGVAGSFVPGGTMPGIAMGTGLGNLVSGLISEKPNSEAKMIKGLEGGMKGYQDWQKLPPAKKLDVNEAGKIPSVIPAAPVTSPGISSSYAPKFAEDMYHRKPEEIL